MISIHGIQKWFLKTPSWNCPLLSLLLGRGRVNCLLVTPNFCPLKVLMGTGKQQDGLWQLRHGDTSMSDEGVKVPGSGLLRTVLTAEKVRLKEKMLPVSQS